MSYDDLVNTEVKSAQYLAIIRPRTRVQGFSVYAGDTYNISLENVPYVSSVKVGSEFLSSSTSPSLSSGEYYFDESDRVLYVHLSDDSDPDDSFVVATIELYVGTFDAHWYRVPTIATGDQVYFDPLIQKSPQIKGSISDLTSGFIPVQSTDIVLSNAEHTLEPYLHSYSFNQCEIELYHWLSEQGELDVDNIKLVLKGLCSNFAYNQSTVSITVLDRVDLMQSEWRNTGENFYSSTLFPNINPSSIGRPIKYIYGRKRGVVPTNVTYVSTEPTTSNNRSHAVMSEVNNIGELTFTAPASPVSTGTRTYLNTCAGLAVGDSVIINTDTDYFRKITVVNYVSNYIEHASISVAASAGDTVKRGFVSLVTIVKSDIVYEALYGRDYTCSGNLLSSGVAGFTFETTLEANLSIPETLGPTDKIFCTVYGTTNTVTLDGSPFGTNSPKTGNLANPVVILFNIFKTQMGLSESEINLTSFETLLTDVGDQDVGMCIPQKSLDKFPKIKDVVISLLGTILARVYVDDDMKWSVAIVAPQSTEQWEVNDEEIFDGSLSVKYDFKDILSDVVVEYDEQESSVNNSQGAQESVTQYSENAALLHGVNKQKTFESLHIHQDQAQNLCDKLSFIFGDRDGIYEFSVPTRLYPSTISESVIVQREKLPGFNFESGTENQRSLVIIGVQKSLNQVNLQLTDQKGIEENESSWPV